MDWYTATCTRSLPILHVQAAADCWNGTDSGRSISKKSRFQSYSYANNVATTHVVYSYYEYSSTVLWVWLRKQSKHSRIYVWIISKPQTATTHLKILEAAYLPLLLFRCRTKKTQRFLMGQKHISWCAFFTWSKYVPFFGSMWTCIHVFGTCPIYNLTAVGLED